MRRLVLLSAAALLLAALLVPDAPGLRAAGPFGVVGDRWDAGNRLEQRGDFAGAVAEYQKALEAARTLRPAGVEPKQAEILRACAVMGSEARLAGARAGQQHMAGGGAGAAAIRIAGEKSRQAFEAETDRQEKARPELADGCP